tara:strand:+ start:364 stop:528 length:165 start_codon:yes stop_codon:yes gene_type:complete
MNTDTARTASAIALVLCVITFVLLLATGSRDFEGYVAVSLLAIMSIFVGATQDS